MKREMLGNLERALRNGAGVPPASIRGELAGLLASTASLAQQARAANDQNSGTTLATVQARTRATVEEISRDLYEHRIFDPYLRFSSAQDEAAYRRREEQTRRAINDALAQGTPEGDLLAARLMDRQLQDAGAHGADASPEFRTRLDRNRQNMTGLEAALSERELALSGERSEPRPESADRSAPATPEQLASVLATLRMAGIEGGIPAHNSGHGLSVDANSPDQGRGART